VRPGTGDPHDNPALGALLRDEIRRGGPISFARFMEAALYQPALGYYAGAAARVGRAGDFFTASHVGPIFGRCVARQLAEIDRVLEAPDPFVYVEHGAGRGYLARDVLDAVSRCDPARLARTTIRLVDRSAAMRAEAAARVPEAEVLEAGRAEGAAGAVLAVELFDALPVHRLRRRRGALREIAVGLDGDGRFVEAETDPSPEVAAVAARYGAAPEEGDEAEVCLAAGPVLAELARSIGRGYLLLFDYGAHAQDLYSGRRRRGTLLAYRRHVTSEDYLAAVGSQDLTAHVNWSQVEDAAQALGLTVAGFTTQDRFLIQNGILEAFGESDSARWNEPEQVRERLRAKQLIDPGGMGRAFQVLILGKGVPEAARLRGLEDPFGEGTG